jgi:hypothetical protein
MCVQLARHGGCRGPGRAGDPADGPGQAGGPAPDDRQAGPQPLTAPARDMLERAIIGTAVDLASRVVRDPALAQISDVTTWYMSDHTVPSRARVSIERSAAGSSARSSLAGRTMSSVGGASSPPSVVT